MCIQAETYQCAPGKALHGYSGPLKVSYGGHANVFGHELLDVVARYDSERGIMEDPNIFYECNKYAVRFSSIIVFSIFDGGLQRWQKSDHFDYYRVDLNTDKSQITDGLMLKQANALMFLITTYIMLLI